MCLECWDASKRKKIMKTMECDGRLTPFMTVAELKSKIIEEWHHTKKTSYQVYKDAVFHPPADGLEWIEMLNELPMTLKVKFI